MSIVLPEALVLDCTVTVPWYLTDESSELSEALFHALDSHRLVVPVLWRLEFVSAMRAAFRGLNAYNRASSAGLARATDGLPSGKRSWGNAKLQ